jgi:hypothetical protein
MTEQKDVVREAPRYDDTEQYALDRLAYLRGANNGGYFSARELSSISNVLERLKAKAGEG